MEIPYRPEALFVSSDNIMMSRTSSSEHNNSARQLAESIGNRSSALGGGTAVLNFSLNKVCMWLCQHQEM